MNSPRKMTSKFPGTCKACRNPIRVGDPILYTPGNTTHADCIAVVPAGQHRDYPRAQVAETAPTTGTVEIRRPSNDRNDSYVVGRTVGLKDGSCAVVVQVLGKVKDDWHGWMTRAMVRPATETETAAFVAAKAEHDARQAAERAARCAARDAIDPAGIAR